MKTRVTLLLSFSPDDASHIGIVRLVFLLRKNSISLTFIFFLLSFILFFNPLSLFPQSPQGFNYQAVVRNAAGTPLANNNTGFKFSILKGSATGTVVYSETFDLNTNAQGVVNLVVGTGTPVSGTFSTIDWSNGPYYLKVEMDPAGGTSYALTETKQLQSVPYALYSPGSGIWAKNGSNIYFNSGKVGIGTQTPYGLLHMKGTSPTNTILYLEPSEWNSIGDYTELWLGDLNHTIRGEFLNGMTFYDIDKFQFLGGKVGIGTSTPAGRLEVKGFAAQSDEVPLFEVKRDDGYTVFAVYPDGVRIYVKDDTGKGSKSGFAVGGFNPAKGLTGEFLRVTPDSVRVYVADDVTKGKKGGFAVGGYNPVKSAGEEYLRVTSDSVRIYIQDKVTSKGSKGGFAVGGFNPVKGLTGDYFNVSGKTEAEQILGDARVMWYPIKEAFRAGNVLIESKDSVGTNSWASGYRSKAIGDYSQALGYQAIARKDYSTAIGYQAVANKINSFAFGQWAYAKNEESYALGRGAIAEGFRSFAFGSAGVDSAGQTTGVAYAKGDYSFAIGQGSQSLGFGSFALGLADTSRGNYSISMGYKTLASMTGSTSIGYRTTASGYQSTAMGGFTTASGDQSTSMGNGTEAAGTYSTAMGDNTTASGTTSTAMGAVTTASGPYSTSMGFRTIASGWNATTMGSLTTASGSSSTAMGEQTTASGDYSTAIGFGSTASGRFSNALGFSPTSSGRYSLAMGYSTIASGWYSTAMGYGPTALGRSSTAMGIVTKANTYGMVAVGSYNDTTKYHGTDSYIFWYDDDPLFVVGKGSSGGRSNAMTILKNGRMGLQSVTNPTYALELPNNSTIGIGQARAYNWATYSDGRFKSNLSPLPYGLEDIMQLSPMAYIHNNSIYGQGGIEMETNGQPDIGLIAQEVYTIIPEAVVKPTDEETDLWSMSYDKLVPVLIKAMQEQQGIIECQQKQIDELKSLVYKLAEK
jgi:hypothetical protein